MHRHFNEGRKSFLSFILSAMINPQKITILLFLIGATGLVNRGLGQSKAVPPIVKNNFTLMFPRAKNMEWEDKLSNFQVFFSMDNLKCEAKFGEDGKWISTEKQIMTDSLPAAVKNELQSGKYSDWTILSAFRLDVSGQGTVFRVDVTKGELPKRILSFNASGQLIKDNLSL